MSLTSGDYTPLQFVKSMSYTLVNVTEENEENIYDISDGSESGNEIEKNDYNHKCRVCLQSRQTTWIFLPCRLTNCCGECSSILNQIEQQCLKCSTLLKVNSRYFLIN